MGRTIVKLPAHTIAKLYLEGKTLQEIGDMLGVSRERIRQLLVRAGYIVKSLKAGVKVNEKIQNKKLVDAVFIESANREMEILWERARSAEHNLGVIKKSRIKLIDGFKETLYAIRELNNNPEIDELINSQLIDFKHYVVKMKGEENGKENYAEGQDFEGVRGKKVWTFKRNNKSGGFQRVWDN